MKDEKNLDKFDVIRQNFPGLQALSETEIAEIPTEWLQSLTEKFLTEEEKVLKRWAAGKKLWKAAKPA